MRLLNFIREIFIDALNLLRSPGLGVLVGGWYPAEAVRLGLGRG